jgi:glycosyltransferase involved in cell wall biosynthesis
MFQQYLDNLLGLHGYNLILALIFAVFYIIRIFYLIIFTGRILFKKKPAVHDPVPVSIIYTVRNEEERLRNNLPPLLSINTSKFEVIVVDDVSQDNTLQVLGMMRERSDKLKVTMLHQETRYSIKMAQNIAIKASGYDWILQAPITYENATPEWIGDITSALGNNKNVVIGYSGILPGPGAARLFYRIENFLLFTKSVGFILNGLPFVYAEENVAFEKKKYFEIGGHGLKINEPFANLELLINHFIQKKNTSVLYKASSAIKKTEPVRWHDYFDLLNKSIRIEKHLSISRKMMLVFDEITKLLYLPVLIVASIMLYFLWPFITALIFIQLTLRMVIIKILQNRLNERKIFIPSLLYDLAIPYYKFFHRWFFNQKRQKQKWKIKV